MSPTKVVGLSTVLALTSQAGAPMSIWSPRSVMRYWSAWMEPLFVPWTKAVVCDFVSLAETSTLVMSQPWRPGDARVPPELLAVAFSVPNVPLVSRFPLSSFTCEAKKLQEGLLGPERQLLVPG